MKVWVEWGKNTGVEHYGTVFEPKVFSSAETLLEYWRRVYFPADEVNSAYRYHMDGMLDYVTCGTLNNQRFAKEVELDDYFVKKKLEEEQIATETRKKAKRVSKAHKA